MRFFRVRRSTAVLAFAISACGGARQETPLDGGSGDADASGDEATAAWPMFQRNPGHTGSTVGALGMTPALTWAFASPGAGQSMRAPSVGANGMIYVVADAPTAGSSSAELHALRADGSEAWNALLGAAPTNAAGAPIVGLDGSIYVQIAQSGVIFAFTGDGSVRWQTPPGSDSAGLTACSDGTLYTGLVDGTVAAVDPATGAIRWQFQADSAIASYAACGADGSIYAPTTTTKKLYALHPDGTSSWTLDLSDQATSPPTVGNDGTVYVGTLDGHVIAVAPAGTVAWSVTTAAAVTAIALGDGPTVYVASNDLASTHVLSSIDGTGQVQWSASLSDGIQPPIVTPDGYVFANLFGGGLAVVSPNGNVVDTVPFGASPTSFGLAVSSAGLIFAGSGDGKLYAFGP